MASLATSLPAAGRLTLPSLHSTGRPRPGDAASTPLLGRQAHCRPAVPAAAAAPSHRNYFEVEDISPPPKSLGLHQFAPNTHNGDEIEVQGDSYVVQKVVLRYRLVRGRYRQDHRRLEVRRTGRYLYNQFLETMYSMDLPPDATNLNN